MSCAMSLTFYVLLWYNECVLKILFRVFTAWTGGKRWHIQRLLWSVVLLMSTDLFGQGAYILDLKLLSPRSIAKQKPMATRKPESSVYQRKRFCELLQLLHSRFPSKAEILQSPRTWQKHNLPNLHNLQIYSIFTIYQSIHVTFFPPPWLLGPHFSGFGFIDLSQLLLTQ